MVTQAISLICRKKESVTDDSYIYVKFPFGMLDYNGLKDLQAYYEHSKTKKLQSEDRLWLVSARVWE